MEKVADMILSLDHHTTPHVNSMRFSDKVFQKRLLILQTNHYFGSTHGETEIQLLRFSFNVMTRNVKLRVHSNDPVSWIGPSGMDDIIPGSHFFYGCGLSLSQYS